MKIIAITNKYVKLIKDNNTYSLVEGNRTLITSEKVVEVCKYLREHKSALGSIIAIDLEGLDEKIG